MKIEIMRFLFSISLLCFPSLLFTQNHDNIWLFGYDSNLGNTDWGGSVMDFSSVPPEIYYEFREMNFNITNVSICDKEGNLLFYTNGNYIANQLHELMENGDELSPGLFHYPSGFIAEQGVLALPMPEDSLSWFLLHLSLGFDNDDLSTSSPQLFSSIVNFSENNPFGEVTNKNEILITGKFFPGKLTAVRHGNGRDWWILVRTYEANEYYKLLLNPNGIEIVDSITIGEGMPFPGIGQAVFSPDGSKYVTYNLLSFEEGNYVDIYDFDRCSGNLHNPIQFTFADSAFAGGAAISPNSKYLYLSSCKFVYQYDLESNNIESTKDTIAVYDGFLEGPVFRTQFFASQLGPDGKIYINTPNGTHYLHVINNPNLPGDSSNFCQRCIELPTWNALSLPNFPNYRLKYLENSPCDTLRQVPTANWDYEINDLEIHFQDSSFHDIRSWSWDFGDGDIDSIAHPTHEYEEVGEYEVCLVVENPRGIDTLCQTLLILPSSIDDNDSDIALTVFPNPTEDKVMVEWHGLNARNGEILIYNSLGQLVWRKPTNRRVASEIDLSEWPNGLYWMQLKVNDEIIGSKKLLKQ